MRCCLLSYSLIKSSGLVGQGSIRYEMNCFLTVNVEIFPKVCNETSYFLMQNKERTERIGRISLFCWMGSSILTTLIEVCYVLFIYDFILSYFQNLYIFVCTVSTFKLPVRRDWEAFGLN